MNNSDCSKKSFVKRLFGKYYLYFYSLCHHNAMEKYSFVHIYFE